VSLLRFGCRVILVAWLAHTGDLAAEALEHIVYVRRFARRAIDRIKRRRQTLRFTSKTSTSTERRELHWTNRSSRASNE